LNTAKNYVLIIASGGIDSTACINYYKKIGFEIELIFFDYGQIARKKEIKAITAISNYYNSKLNIIQIKSKNTFQDGLIIGRNASFYFLALMNFNKKNGIIASGIHYGTGYYDCSDFFLNQIQIITDQYSHGAIKMEAPFLNFTKPDIIEYCKIENIPLHLTYSCERGRKQPCGKCATCKDLIAIYDRKNY